MVYRRIRYHFIHLRLKRFPFCIFLMLFNDIYPNRMQFCSLLFAVRKEKLFFIKCVLAKKILRMRQPDWKRHKNPSKTIFLQCDHLKGKINNKCFEFSFLSFFFSPISFVSHIYFWCVWLSLLKAVFGDAAHVVFAGLMFCVVSHLRRREIRFIYVFLVFLFAYLPINQRFCIEASFSFNARQFLSFILFAFALYLFSVFL